MVGGTRCRVHGGVTEATAGLKESLYSKRLRQSFKTSEDQKLFEELPKATDLSEEIKVARMRVIRYQDLLESGVDVIYSKDRDKRPLAVQITESGQADVECKTVALDVHSLLRDALQSLRALCVSQDSIHPGSEIGGNLRLTITLAGTAKPKLPIPDLTDESIAQRLLPPTGATIDVVPERSGRATGYEDDE